MKAKCPYCGRKITYGTRFSEKGIGEHTCKSCKKPSNVVQNKRIWVIFAIASLIALLILLFYFAFANVVQREFNESGSYAFLVTLFFGKLKTLKWAIWEILPFLMFYFVSPLFIEYRMQKKYAYTSADHIDLDTDFIPPINGDNSQPLGSTRVISKIGTTMVEDDYDFKDISSSSGKSGNTQKFNLNEAVTAIDPESYVKSGSGKSDAPLKKLERPKPTKAVEEQELYRVRVLKEEEQRQRRELQAQAKNMDKQKEKSFSANRKF